MDSVKKKESHRAGPGGFGCFCCKANHKADKVRIKRAVRRSEKQRVEYD
jgi:hypothetical protein